MAKVLDHQCIDDIEKLYYTAYPDDVLLYIVGVWKTLPIMKIVCTPFVSSSCSTLQKVYRRGARGAREKT